MGAEPRASFLSAVLRLPIGQAPHTPAISLEFLPPLVHCRREPPARPRCGPALLAGGNLSHQGRFQEELSSL